MFKHLPIDIIYHIVEYISVEATIYLFPDKHHKIDYSKHNYSWAMHLEDLTTRIRVCVWLIKYNYIPLDAYVLDRLSAVGNLYLIENIFTLIKLSDLNPTYFYTHRAIDSACAYGHHHVLEWWWKNVHIDHFKYSSNALDTASTNGHLNILNWWKRRYIEGIVLKYTRDAMDRTNYTSSLDWWLEMYHKYDLNIKYSTKSIDLTQDIKILNWWLNSYLMYGTTLKYKKYSINHASSSGNIEILNWWKSASIQQPLISIKYDESAIDCASQNGHLHILEWWLKQHQSESNFKFIYTNFAIDSASQNGHLHILQWWFKQYQSGNCLMKRSVHAVNNASRNGHVHVLNWWLNLYIKYNIPMLYDLSALEWSLENTESLNWWMKICNQYRFVFQRIHWNQYYSCIE